MTVTRGPSGIGSLFQNALWSSWFFLLSLTAVSMSSLENSLEYWRLLPRNFVGTLMVSCNLPVFGFTHGVHSKSGSQILIGGRINNSLTKVLVILERNGEIPVLLFFDLTVDWNVSSLIDKFQVCIESLSTEKSLHPMRNSTPFFPVRLSLTTRTTESIVCTDYMKHYMISQRGPDWFTWT